MIICVKAQDAVECATAAASEFTGCALKEVEVKL